MGSSLYVFQAVREAGKHANHDRISEKCPKPYVSEDRANREYPEGIAKEQENDC